MMRPIQIAGATLFLLACGAPLQQSVPGRLFPPVPVALEGARLLMVPVLGVGPEQVPDSYHAPRDGGREHQASDILAPRGTPVLSADDGTIVRMGQNRRGGNMIYAIDPSAQLVYYYAHLDQFADNVAAGRRVSRGDVLGYVGNTGNAAFGAPHLHFQLMRRPPDGSFYGGEPIDPRPYFIMPGRAP